MRNNTTNVVIQEICELLKMVIFGFTVQVNYLGNFRFHGPGYGISSSRTVSCYKRRFSVISLHSVGIRIENSLYLISRSELFSDYISSHKQSILLQQGLKSVFIAGMRLRSLQIE